MFHIWHHQINGFFVTTIISIFCKSWHIFCSTLASVIPSPLASTNTVLICCWYSCLPLDSPCCVTLFPSSPLFLLSDTGSFACDGMVKGNYSSGCDVCVYEVRFFFSSVFRLLIIIAGSPCSFYTASTSYPSYLICAAMRLPLPSYARVRRRCPLEFMTRSFESVYIHQLSSIRHCLHLRSPRWSRL